MGRHGSPFHSFRWLVRNQRRNTGKTLPNLGKGSDHKRDLPLQLAITAGATPSVLNRRSHRRQATASVRQYVFHVSEPLMLSPKVKLYSLKSRDSKRHIH